MGLQEQIAEAIVIAFDELGGDPQRAVEAALRHDTVASWLQQETTKIAFIGGAEMVIPGLHALTIPAGISYLLHKMAHISWGVGAVKGAYIVETTQHSDLRNILTLWANSSYFSAQLLDHLAISMDAFEYALTEEGNTALQELLTNQEEHTNVVVNTLHVLDSLTSAFTGDERAQHLVQTMTGREAMDELIVSARDNVPSAQGSTINKPLNRRISTRLAGRLAVRISARVPARLLVGFLPVAGAVVNAFFNAQTLRSMAESAEKYYDNVLTRDSLQSK